MNVMISCLPGEGIALRGRITTFILIQRETGGMQSEEMPGKESSYILMSRGDVQRP